MKNGPLPRPWPKETPTISAECQTPPSPRERRVKLKTISDVSREMAKLYREARNGHLDISDASKLANMLAILSRTIETSELEKRVEALERTGQVK